MSVRDGWGTVSFIKGIQSPLLNFLGKEKTVSNIIHFLKGENMEWKMKVQNIADISNVGHDLLLSGMYALFAWKQGSRHDCLHDLL